MLQNLPEFCWIFNKFDQKIRDFPKMKQFWENPKIAYLIFVLEMRTFNLRTNREEYTIFVLKRPREKKHLIFIFTNI